MPRGRLPRGRVAGRQRPPDAAAGDIVPLSPARERTMTRRDSWMALALVACVAASSAAAEARPRPPAAGPVVLAGEIHAPGGHSGILELRLDGKLQAAMPAATGAFEIAMPRAGNAGMVSLEFTAPGLRLRSLLGRQGRLANRAGADGRLAATHEDGLRLSPLSSALAVLASRVDGKPPRSDVALASAVKALRGHELLQATTVLARLAVDPDALPPGFGDGLALLEHEAAFDDFARAHPAFLEAPEDILDALPTTPLTATEPGSVLAFTAPRRAPGEPLDDWGLVVERVGADYRVHDEFFDGPAYAGGIDAGGALALVPHAPLSIVDFLGPPCPSTGDSETMAVSTLVGRDFRRHWRGSDVALWQAGQDHVVTYPECPGLAPSTTRRVTLHAAPDMLRAPVLTSPRRFPGRHALPLFCPLVFPHTYLALTPCDYADHVFARDGSGVAYPQGEAPRPFTWAAGARGAMRLDYGDMVLRLWIVDPADRVASALVYVVEGEVVGYDGTSSGYATMVRGGIASKADDAAGAGAETGAQRRLAP